MTYIVNLLDSIISFLKQLIPAPLPGESNLGYFILTIFLSPIIILIISAIVGRPRSGRAIEVLISVLGGAIIGFAVFTYIISFVIGTLFFT